MAKELKELVASPLITCDRNESVLEAVKKMVHEHVGAVLVTERGKVIGIFTERDVLTRVISRDRQAALTQLSQVMTRQVTAISENASLEEALLLMVENHFRHLPLVDSHGIPTGMVSIRLLFSRELQKLSQQNDSLISYLGSDYPGD